MAADCKSAGEAYGGSNPSLPTICSSLRKGSKQAERRPKGGRASRIASVSEAGGPAQ